MTVGRECFLLLHADPVKSFLACCIREGCTLLLYAGLVKSFLEYSGRESSFFHVIK